MQLRIQIEYNDEGIILSETGLIDKISDAGSQSDPSQLQLIVPID
jgi:hypothetical protein